MGVMTAYEGMFEMIRLDTTMQELGVQLSKTKNKSEAEALEKQINAMDIRFIELKHKLQNTQLV